MTTKRFIIIVTSIIAVGLLCLLLLSIFLKKDTRYGTSSYPALDIASGEINKIDRESIMPTFRNITGDKHLKSSDVILDPSTYKKTYQTDGGYTISARFTVPKVSSQYEAVFQYLNKTTSIGMYAACTDTQPSGKECVDKTKGQVDYGD